MLQGLSETQPSSLAKDYSMNEIKTGYLLLLKMKKCVFLLPRTCRDIVGSIKVICFEYHNPSILAKDYSMNEKRGICYCLKRKSVS